MGYSIKQKIDICLMAEANPDMTQTDLASWAKTRFGSSKPPSQTTISRILAKKDELISLKEHEFKLIRRRRLSNPLLRKVLLEWITQCVWNNIPITAPIIISSASNFWKQLPEAMREGNGEFSFKWCSQFLSKVNINLGNIERELYSNRLKIWTFEERDQLKAIFEGIDPKKIFTLNEIFLSHDLALDKAQYSDSSDFITCMLCYNADGSEKLDPLIIGRYENYPSFEGKSSIKASTKHGVSYHSNRMKWLTSTVFYDWLSVLDKRLALVNKDIIIVLDDSASHRVVNIKLQRIRLLYTSCQAANFLPMSWGVQNDMKLLFRIEEYKSLLQKQKSLNNKLLSKEELTFNMSETFDLIKTAWGRVPQTRIQSSWKQCGILPESITKDFARGDMFSSQLQNELTSYIDQLKVVEEWDILSLLDLSVEQKINKIFLSNEEIIQSSIVDNYDDFDHTSGQLRRAPFSHSLGQGFQRLQKLGRLRNAVSMRSSPEQDFDPDLDLAMGFDFDLDIPDMDSINGKAGTNSSVASLSHINTRLQPMSQLMPPSYSPIELSGYDFDNGRSNSNNSDVMNNFNLDFFAPNLESYLNSPNMMNTQDKLNIIAAFIRLMEDEPLMVSPQTRSEIQGIYRAYLNQPQI